MESLPRIAASLRERPLSLARAFVVRVFHLLVERFARNRILTYASAMSVQLMTGLVPLGILALLLLGVFGKQGYWQSHIAPYIADKASSPVYQAVDYTAGGLMSAPHPFWLAFAVPLVVWEVSGVVRTVMGGLNEIFEREEDRSFGHRFGLSFLLAVAIGICILIAAALAVAGQGWLSLGSWSPLWTVARWLSALALLWLAVVLLLRLAPAGKEEARWASLGTTIIVLAWLGVSLVYGWWVTSEASYKSAFGVGVAFLTMFGYLYASSIAFLVGAQVDKLLQEQAASGNASSKGPLDGLL